MHSNVAYAKMEWFKIFAEFLLLGAKVYLGKHKRVIFLKVYTFS
jgi:hypothetical protein